MIINNKLQIGQAEKTILHAPIDPDMSDPLEDSTKGSHHWPVIPVGVIRFCGWWLAFFGLYSSSSVCPFCGQQGCPVGIASAGFMGVIFAILIRSWNKITTFVKTILKRA